MSTTQEMVSPELFSPSTSDTPHSDIDDNSSLASSVTSANSLNKHKSDFTNVPDTWRPSIMACLQASSETQQRHLLTVGVRNEIVRDLVSQMYSAYSSKPDKNFCTLAARH